jgi:hypothetical protein
MLKKLSIIIRITSTGLSTNGPYIGNMPSPISPQGNYFADEMGSRARGGKCEGSTNKRGNVKGRSKVKR